MLDEKLTFEQVSEFEEHLIAATPTQGPIGNEALRFRLGWSEDRYWYIQDRLVRAGLLIKGRGRGGSVLRAGPVEGNLLLPSALRISENDLYDPIVATISSHWVPDHRIQDFGAEPFEFMEGPMRTISFNSFPEEEQEIFQLSCRRWWKRPRDFVVTAEEPDSPSDQQNLRSREVTVLYVPSARARSYRADRGARWIADFEDDLQAVYFGRMP